MEDKKKKILILTADAGFGHRSASLAIEAAIEDLAPDQFSVTLLNPLDDKKAPSFLHDSQSEYDKWVRNVPELWKFGYEISDSQIPTTILETILVVSLFEVFSEILEEFKPDIVVTTYPLYQAPFIAVRSIHKLNIPIITIVTDLASVHQIWFNEKVDLLIVPNNTVKEDAIKAGNEALKIAVMGIPVNPAIFSLTESKQEVRRKLGWDELKTTLLVVGSNRVEHFKDYLNILNHSGFDFQLIVVTGKDKELHEELKQVEWHHSVFLYEFVDQMPAFMRAADLLISKAGGLIVTEALASGLPLLLVDVIPGQESGNAKLVVDSKAGFWVKNSMDFIESVSHLMINEMATLAIMQQNAKKAGKPSSALDIGKIIIDRVLKTNFQEHPKKDFIQKLEKLLNKNEINWTKKSDY